MKKLKVFITRKIPDAGMDLLKKRFVVKIYPKDNAIPRKELEKGVKWCDALLCFFRNFDYCIFINWF